MRKTTCLLAAIAFVLLSSAAVWAAPSSMRVVLYSGSATVTEEHTLAVQNGELHFLLPASAVRDSVRVDVKNAEVSSVVFNKTAAPKEWANAALRREVDAAAQQLSMLQARRMSLEARIELLRESRPNVSTVKEISQLETRLDEHLRALYMEKTALAEPIREAERELKRIKASLEARGTVEEAYDIAVRFSSEVKNGAELPVLVSYSLDGCGWKPSLRINALTAENRVEVTRLAEIEQKTGMDWTNADIILSTANASPRITPADLARWRITPRRKTERLNDEGRERFAEPMVAMEMPSPAAGRSAERKPVYSEEASSAQWALGRRTIPCGESVMLTLDSQKWNAEFYRLLRPARQSVSYLMAKAVAPAPVTLSSSNAQMLVDGVTVGSQAFSFSGRECDIAFGPDEAVTAEMRAEKAQSGDTGIIIGKRKTYEWKWTITVTNAHSKAVAVRVEDAEPKAGDRDIEIRIVSEPAAEAEKNALVWKLNVPAGEKSVIRHQVSFSAPEELNPSPGR